MTAYEAIMKSLKEHPNDWYHSYNGADTLKHKHTNVQIWMDKLPVFFTNVYQPSSISLNLWQKYKLYKACKNLVEQQIVAMLKG
jgi:hypothetical protein